MRKAIGTLQDRARSVNPETVLAVLHDQLNAEDNFRVEYQQQAPSEAQLKALNSLMGQYLKGQSDQRNARLHLLSVLVGRPVHSSTDLTKWEVSCVINAIKTEGEEAWSLSGKGIDLLDYCGDHRPPTRSRDSQSQERDPGNSVEPAAGMAWVQADLSHYIENSPEPPDLFE